MFIQTGQFSLKSMSSTIATPLFVCLKIQGTWDPLDQDQLPLDLRAGGFCGESSMVVQKVDIRDIQSSKISILLL